MLFQGGMGAHFSKQLSKPPPIIKNVSISFEQCYNGCVLPIDIEKWVIQNDMKVMKKETIYIDNPHGIDTNKFFIIRERGNEVNDYTIGDIKIIVSIEEDDIFERNSLDLIFKKTITLKESLCGVSFVIRHLNGDNLSLMNNNKPTIIKPSLKKVINKMGFTRDENIGNLIIIFNVEFPDVLTQEQISSL
jgi:DnaJ homolog subfamily A member 2